MRRAWRGWIVGVSLGLAGGCAAPPAAEPGRERVAERFQHFLGSIHEVAAVGGEPVVVVWSETVGTKVFWVSGETAVTRDGRPAALADLRVGDGVEIWAVYGSNLAREVIARTP